jgi:hypothetical protein
MMKMNFTQKGRTGASRIVVPDGRTLSSMVLNNARDTYTNRFQVIAAPTKEGKVVIGVAHLLGK